MYQNDAHCTVIGHDGKQLETKDNYVLEGYTGIGYEGQLYNDTQVENMKDNYVLDKQSDAPATARDVSFLSCANFSSDSCINLMSVNI